MTESVGFNGVCVGEIEVVGAEAPSASMTFGGSVLACWWSDGEVVDRCYDRRIVGAGGGHGELFSVTVPTVAVVDGDGIVGAVDGDLNGAGGEVERR